MNKADKSLYDRMVSCIAAKKRGDNEKLKIFSELQESRGVGAANHWMTLARGWAAVPRINREAIGQECMPIFAHPSRVAAVSHPQRRASHPGAAAVAIRPRARP